MSNSNNGDSSAFWSGIVVAGMMYVITDSLSLSVIVALAIMFIVWLLKGVKKQTQQTQDMAREYTFDFDALSPTYKSELLKQQFNYFIKYNTTQDGDIDLCCVEDELDGYRFSFWVEYAIDTSRQRLVKVKQGDLVCTIYISSNKGKSYGYEKFMIYAPINGVVTKILRETIQKGSTLFRVNKSNVVSAVEVEEVVEVQDAPTGKTVLFEDVIDNTVVPDDKEIEVESLNDVLKWDMPDVDDIAMPEEESDDFTYDASAIYHAIITNLSDFDWHNFKAVCYSSTDSTKKEIKNIGDVRIGAKTSLSSHYNMFYLEGEDSYGTKKRFRPFILEKDSDITITTIFAER